MARIKLDMPESFLFRTRIPVRITDINYGNHLGNDSLLSIVQEARLQFLMSLGYSEISIEGTAIIMGDAAIVYKAQAFYGDILTLDVSVTDISRKSCDFVYRISNQNQQLVALCKTGIVFFDYNEKKPVRIPQGFLDKVSVSDQT